MPPGLGKSTGDPDSDDFVAQVLAKEARDSSAKYALGMKAYTPARPTGAAPKPNTRFLRHIINQTDSHNAALKRKEEREARERMRQHREQKPNPSSTRDDTRDHRHRSHRSDDRGSRRERDDREDRHRSHRRRSRSRSPDTNRPRASRRERERDREDDRHRSSRKSRRYRSYSRSRSRSPRSRKDSDRRRRHRRRSTSRSYSRSPELKDRKDRDSARRIESRKPTSPSESKTANDSDPLEDLVGPLPKEQAPIRSRGRGAYTNSSNIDAHFADDYDPTLDVQMEDNDAQTGNRSNRRPVAGLMTGDDDWDLALEALRDRTRWKQAGEDRLREAGFNNDIVERWKSSSTATGADGELMENVKWSAKREGREWDRGKVVDDDGHVNVKASW